MMTAGAWNSKNKTDLMIEVWEKLDCESVGSSEIEAIEIVVRECYGESAVDAPVVIARLLADEGAVLRHSEILEMDVKRRLNSPYEAMFRNLLKFSTFDEAETSLRNLENLRKKLASEGDAEGLRRVKDAALGARDEAREISARARGGSPESRYFQEIGEWFTIWMQSPEIFEHWVKARRSSAQFAREFAYDGVENDESSGTDRSAG